jgi:hypothetical protein
MYNKKLVRVPAALKRQLEWVVNKNDTVWKDCPSGHDIRVEIVVQYVPKGPAPRAHPTIKVPVVLSRRLKKVVDANQTIRANCPFDHDVRVEIKIEYVPKGGPQLNLRTEIQRKRVPLGPKMQRTNEPFGEEYFQALLDSALGSEDKRFVRLFKEHNNKPMAPIEWMRKYFNKMSHAKTINSLCRQHRIPASFGRTGEYLLGENIAFDRREKYKFYVMEPIRKARG